MRIEVVGRNWLLVTGLFGFKSLTSAPLRPRPSVALFARRSVPRSHDACVAAVPPVPLRRRRRRPRGAVAGLGRRGACVDSRAPAVGAGPRDEHPWGPFLGRRARQRCGLGLWRGASHLSLPDGQASRRPGVAAGERGAQHGRPGIATRARCRRVWVGRAASRSFKEEEWIDAGGGIEGPGCDDRPVRHHGAVQRDGG